MSILARRATKPWAKIRASPSNIVIYSNAFAGVAARIDADFVGRLGRIPDTVLRHPSRHRRFWHATHACFIMLGTLRSPALRAGVPSVVQNAEPSRPRRHSHGVTALDRNSGVLFSALSPWSDERPLSDGLCDCFGSKADVTFGSRDEPKRLSQRHYSVINRLQAPTTSHFPLPTCLN